ncbi:MAG: pyroglutamyl-peptidase I, partial [Burkholderiaceae bacterium]|nr:pyroglutamyl-peptidase I [Burkholderiaceae bacterium]
MATITKVLISGFEPFGGAKLNPSELLVAELKRIEFKNLELSTVILPVEFDRASDVLLRKVNELKPEMVVAFGQAEGRTAITPEKIAINLDDARIPDNSGDQRKNQVIDKGGSDGYFSTLPVEAMVDAMKAVGYPAEISLSAGAFVCNHVFYSLQRALIGTGIRSGFVHLPLVNEQAAEFP